jgi:flagellar motor switch protein FliN/FliY
MENIQFPVLAVEDTLPAVGVMPVEVKKQKSPVVEKVEFAPFEVQSQIFTGRKKDLKFFNHIPLVISGELGKAHLTVRELLKLEEGSAIKLDKLAGENATILINGQYIGSAEIVVLNERFGLRVTTVGQPDEQEEKKELEVVQPENFVVNQGAQDE